MKNRPSPIQNRIALSVVAFAFVLFGSCANPSSPVSTEASLYSVDFSSSPTGWYTGTSSDLYCTAAMTGTAYTLTETGNDEFQTYTAPYGYSPYAGKIAVPYGVQSNMGATLNNGATFGTSVIKFNRTDSQNFSLLSIDQSSGQYRISQYAADSWVAPDPVPWTTSVLIHPTGTNTIKIIQHANSLDLYINGSLANSYSISPPAGTITVGVGVENFDTGTTGSESVTATFTDFTIYSEPN